MFHMNTGLFFQSLRHLQGRHGGLHDSRFRARHDVNFTAKFKALPVIRNKIQNKDRLLIKKNNLAKENIPKFQKLKLSFFFLRPFHKTLPKPSAFDNRISVRFYENDCTC